MERKELENLKELNKSQYEYLCEELLLNDLEKKILLDRIKDKSIIEMSMENNISTTKVSRIIKKIKNKISKI
jgi:DNA-directed RNA polymerase specialized sigma subunit